MSADHNILGLPDSMAWRAGILHERERISRMADALAEHLILVDAPVAHKQFARGILQGFAQAIRETP
jgi:hypothetical protein